MEKIVTLNKINLRAGEHPEFFTGEGGLAVGIYKCILYLKNYVIKIMS
jgi:hypothetical protein